ncbi:MAG TPA: ABC transporter substrate-binding protein [Ramlibacter sp.]|nr:ABC transporter substrate-binding protein [Ramlibacter sp.]
MPKLRWFAALSAALVLATAPCAAVTLRYSGTTAPLTMDPHATNDFVTTALVRQVYDSVVALENNMELGPGIATEWSYQGQNTWRFKLRQGVKFHDGSALTADDVAFSILRQKTSPLYAALFGNIKEVRKVDANTIDVVSNAADPILPRRMVRLFVMSRAWATANGLEKVPDLGAQATEAHSLRHANGTGPMKLVAQEPGRKTVFQRNKAYWGPSPGNVDEAVYTPIASAPTRIAALLSGEVDLVTDVPLQDIERLKTTTGFRIQEVPQLLVMLLEMDGSRDVALDAFDKSGQPLKTNPLKDVRVRRAFAHAIDANLIVQRVMRGHARVVGIPAAPGFAGFQQDLAARWPTDPARAKALLAEAGYPNGFGIQLNCPLERYTNAEEICKAVASMLARIGVDVKVKAMIWPEFSRMLVQGPNSSFHLIGAAGNSGDLQDMLVSVLATRDKQKARGGQNWAMWTNRDLDAVVDQLVVSFDPAKRTELYRAGLTIAKDQVHGVYLHQPYLIWGTKASVSVPARADSAVMLQNVVIK